MHVQPSLFGSGTIGFDARLSRLRRLELGGGAWIEHLPGWIRGHDAVFDTLARTTRWRAERRVMYEREVDVPRLVARFPDDGPGHPVLFEASAVLSARYGWRLDRLAAALYRGGDDSVAPHGDRMGPLVDDCVIALVSLGSPRRFLLQPASGGGSLRFELGWGDLLVMGGTCQRTWRHGVPKARTAAPRISVQLRPAVPVDGA